MRDRLQKNHIAAVLPFLASRSWRWWVWLHREPRRKDYAENTAYLIARARWDEEEP
jgi:hypothetical protein